MVKRQLVRRAFRWLGLEPANAYGIPLHRNEPVAPFFIVGSGRCGTTLLRRLLMQASHVHIPAESHSIPSLVSTYRDNFRLTWANLVCLGVGAFEFNYDFAAAGVSVSSVAHELRQVPFERQSVACIISRVYEYHAEQSGHAGYAWGDKTPLYVMHLDTLKAVFPRATVIHLLRDGADVVESILRMNRPEYGPERAARRWVKAIDRFDRFAAKNSSHALEVRYEQLVSSPAQCVQQICRFVGVECDTTNIEEEADVTTMRDVAVFAHHEHIKDPVSINHIGHGRRSLTAEQRNLISAIIGRHLVARGYSPL